MKVNKKVSRKAAKNRLAWTCAARIRFLDAEEFRRVIRNVGVLLLMIEPGSLLETMILGEDSSCSSSAGFFPSLLSLLVVEGGGGQVLGVVGVELVVLTLVVKRVVLIHRRVVLVG